MKQITIQLTLKIDEDWQPYAIGVVERAIGPHGKLIKAEIIREKGGKGEK